MKELPKFKSHGRENVTRFVSQMLIHPKHPDESYFRRLIEYEDGHYGLVFSLDYFASDSEPTKSQWNSLKKKLKRHDKLVFVFKEHSLRVCTDEGQEKSCGYIEFGFFAQAII